jgi:hypothetical protein
MSTWLYQYWLFSFTTAKYWGRGPRAWTSENLGLRPADSSVAQSPAIAASPGQQSATKPIMEPSQLCKWAIHVEYDQIISETGSVDENGGDDSSNLHRSTAHEWPSSWNEPKLEQRLANALEHNDFSDMGSSSLPISVSQLVKAAEESSNEILIESLGFAIIGRNEEQVDTLMRRAKSKGIDLSDLYPAHLAAVYLDGGSTCCNILRAVIRGMRRSKDTLPEFKDTNTNSSGHTILDTLMMTILRNHTSTKPEEVDSNFRNVSGFPGDEVDICGRWDADSECYKSLLASGKSSVPIHWRHKFCNSSIQAICHSILTLDRARMRMIRPSGLFTKYCSLCGLKMQILPLHTMVLVSFHLARDGRPGEDLFGSLCCILSLLACDSTTGDSVEISLPLIFDEDEDEGTCSHSSRTAYQLACDVMDSKGQTWNYQLKAGWNLILRVLHAHEEATKDETDDYYDRIYQDPLCGRCSNEGVPSGTTPFVGRLWAACQAELLTYRRLREKDSWLSPRMDLVAVSEATDDNVEEACPFMRDRLLNPHCICGSFIRIDDDDIMAQCPGQASDCALSNLDDWARSSFISP